MNHTLTRQLGYATLGLAFALVVFGSFATIANAQSATSTTGTTTKTYVFDAHLSGAHEVPPVATTSTSTASTTGHARVWFDEVTASSSGTTTTSMMWNVLHVWNGNDIFGAHLHCGLPGENGPIVVDLFHTATTSAVDINGTLVGTSTISNGNITATTTGCSMPIRNVGELAAALKAGIIYANVHSVQYPAGVARGQLALTSSSTAHSSTTTPPNMCTNNPSNGWYDSAGKWHACNSSGNGNCTASSTMTGWYGSNGIWHSCGNAGNNGNCTASSTVGWYDNQGNWHSCGSGGNNGNGTCPNGRSNQGWYDSNNNWHWCSPNGGNNGGGTTTPPIPGFPGGLPGGMGSGINGLLGKILGNVQHILNTFLPAEAEDNNALRSIRALR